MNIKILGAGLSCIDIIKYENNTKSSLGGTTANVMSFLSAFNKFDVSILLPKMNNKVLESEFNKRNVKIIEFGQNEINIPIIIENLTDDSHSFNGLCGHCNKNLKNIDLPDITDIKCTSIKTNCYNLFFYDRISLGIYQMAINNINGWNFYEPNTMNSYKNFIEFAKSANIVKFSNDRISESEVKNILSDLQESNVSIVIITMGAKGLKYSVRTNGVLSEWIYVKPIKLDHIIDTTGAGDCMSAVFIFLLLNKYPQFTNEISKDLIVDFLDKSQEIAVESCQYMGAQGILESKKAIDKICEFLDVNIYPINVFSNSITFCPYCKYEL